MKKMMICLCCLLLWGCQVAPEQSAQESVTVKNDLIIKDAQDGDGNEEGYYYIKNENELNLLCYYDYQSKQEIYVCHQVECQHQDETCQAVQEGLSFSADVVVYQDHLYIFDLIGGTTVDLFNERSHSEPQIIQLDLDGQNRKVLYELEEGYEFESSHCAFDNQYLYVSVRHDQGYTMDDGTNLFVADKETLKRIDLQTGESEDVLNTLDMTLMGVQGRQMIFEKFCYSEDPYPYLKEKNFKKFDQITMNAKIGYCVVDIDTKESQNISSDVENFGEYCDGMIYYTQEHSLYGLDLKTQKVITLQTLPEVQDSSDYYISYVIDHHLIIEQYDANQEAVVKMYSFNIDTKELRTLHQFTRDPQEVVQIINQTSDHLLVQYDREGHEEKTWAGTMQYEVDKIYVGLISKEDFLNDQNHYQNIQLLGDGYVEN